MRVLVCGDRYWNDYAELSGALLSFIRFSGLIPQDVTVISGAAAGADTLAAKCAKIHGMSLQEYEADWDSYGKAAGPIRNKAMLVDGLPDIVIAFHDSISTSKGTANMIKQARKAGLVVYLYAHSGLTKYE